jgi:vacuolar-type H+-ATPase subunit I/STV1
MLHAFYNQGKLQKIATADVEMVPTPGAAVLLSELNQIIAEQRGVPVDELSIQPNLKEKKAEVQEVARVRDLGEPSVADKDAGKTSSSSVNESEETVASPTATPESTAKKYRSIADKLAKEAAQYRRMAEDLVPTTKKKTKEEV